MRHRSLVVLLASITVAGACGDSTGPKDPTVNGEWTYGATVAGTSTAGVQVDCSITGMRLQLSQNGAVFSGTTSGGQGHCTYNGQSSAPPFDLTADHVRNGVIDGSSVAFDVWDADYHHVGSISGTSMTGTATMNLRFGGEVLAVLTGNWSAVRP